MRMRQTFHFHDIEGIALTVQLESLIGGSALLDHDCTFDVEVRGSMCSLSKCKGCANDEVIEGQICGYDSDSDYSPADEFEGLVFDLRGPCLCDRKVVGPICSHTCCANRRPVRLRRKGNVEIGAEIHDSDDDRDIASDTSRVEGLVDSSDDEPEVKSLERFSDEI